jgi:uncharacterized RDD family membrane protein YckC
MGTIGMDGQNWFYLEQGRPIGPVSVADLVRLFRDGAVSLGTSVWTEGAQDWVQLSEAVPALALKPPPPPISPFYSADRQARGETRLLSRSDLKRPTKSLWSENPSRPWRRYFGRLLDQTISGSLGFMAFAVVMATLDNDAFQRLIRIVDNPETNFLSVWLTIVFAIPINAVFIGFTGSSIGKLIFGIRVLDRSSQPVGFLTALRREVLVWVHGLGLGIPLISLFTVLSGYSRLRKTGSTSWDNDLNIVVTYRPPGLLQGLLAAIGVVLLVAITVVLKAQ